MKFDIPNIITKGVGIAGLGLVLCDSHFAGKIEASSFPKAQKAQSLMTSHKQYLELDSPSIVKQKVKKGIFDYKTDENISVFFNGIAGYFKGFSNMLVTNVVPLALATGTVATKGIVSKTFGVGLLAYGGIFLMQEFLGIGKSH